MSQKAKPPSKSLAEKVMSLGSAFLLAFGFLLVDKATDRGFSEAGVVLFSSGLFVLMLASLVEQGERAEERVELLEWLTNLEERLIAIDKRLN